MTQFMKLLLAGTAPNTRRSAATPSTVNKNYLPLLRALREVASVGDLFLAAKRMALAKA